VAHLVVLTVLSAGVVAAACRALPWREMFPDFICYWTAAELVASGHNPYDPALQARLQRDLGWDEASHGLGICPFLPYYYPPWLALACVPLLPLGYAGAKLAWFFLNVELTLLAAYLVRPAVPGVPPRVPLLLFPIFAFTLSAVLIAQTSLLILFLMVVTWRLLDARQDRLAGLALAWLTLKPQLTVVLLLAVLLWAVRQRRWSLLGSFGVTLALLCLGSLFVSPAWPLQMLNAPREVAPPTALYPSMGNSWFLVCQTAGARGWVLWSLYLAVALPVTLGVLRAALRPAARLSTVFSVSTLAAFLVSPYTRHYDFPVLLVPALVLVGTRLSERAGALLLLALVAIPFAQFILLQHLRPAGAPAKVPVLDFTFFWVPLLLAALWVGTARLRAPSRLRPGAAT
jgi:hypothetical protein